MECLLFRLEAVGGSDRDGVAIAEADAEERSARLLFGWGAHDVLFLMAVMRARIIDRSPLCGCVGLLVVLWEFDPFANRNGPVAEPQSDRVATR
ncbi:MULTISPECIES: hypothetical protein [Rhizobium/Agrobacterium group]|uniref:Uncharacterized protein n=1 Tax=Agrobacterium vitis TaxID=373 RepID=A0ABW9TGF2_AGRVI|nr:MULTISPECIES: hypothetical protein [Rhizobium/Agrobacterium group]MUO30651.1 hypothetical protein [Agrobacterium vitis]MUO43628.1 hypothetical protein [Agrobacterium vitis]